MITLMDVTLVTILTLSTMSGSGGSRPASFPGAALSPEGELQGTKDGGERSMEDEYDALNVRAFTQSGSDTGVNENVNKLLKFGITHSVKMTLNIILLLIITNICMVHWQM